jgi:hypothetical protein
MSAAPAPPRPHPVLDPMLAAVAGIATALATYAAAGIGTLFAFGAIFPGRGHPPLPGAPEWMYVAAFLVACPLLALAAGALVARLVWRGRRPRHGGKPTPDARG